MCMVIVWYWLRCLQAYVHLIKTVRMDNIIWLTRPNHICSRKESW